MKISGSSIFLFFFVENESHESQGHTISKNKIMCKLQIIFLFPLWYIEEIKWSVYIVYIM